MKRIIIIIVALASYAFSVTAQRVLTLDECREMALTNNASVKTAQLSKGVAHATRQEAFTKYFPSISGSFMAFKTDKGLLQYDMDDDIPLPDGNPIHITHDFQLIKDGVSVGANLVWPIFTGGQIYNANKLAEIGEAVAELQSRQSADEVRVTVEKYYWQLATLKAKRATVNQMAIMLDTLENQVSAMVDAGVTLQNDLLEVRIRHNEILTAAMRLDNGINVMKSLLGQYLGLGTEQVDVNPIIDPKIAVSLDDGLLVNPEDALHATTQYQLLAENVKATDTKRKMTLGANLPSVAVGAGYIYNRMLSQWHGRTLCFATVSIPITDWWGGSHAMKSSKLKSDIARIELQDYSEQLQINMRNSWDNLVTAWKTIGVQIESIEQSEENLRLNEVFYFAGTITMTDLLKAQTLYRQSQDQYMDAFGTYQIEKIKYLIATGR